MRKKTGGWQNRSEQYKGPNLITNQTIIKQLRKQIGNEQFYELELAEVKQILTQDNEDYEPGAIKARLLFIQPGKEVQNLIVMIPENPYINYIPIIGEIIICSRRPVYSVDTEQGINLEQYYYISILNILNNQNHNSIPDISIISDEQQPANIQEDKCGSQFYINNNIEKVKYKEGDIIISGRYGHSIKFSYNYGANGKTMLPMISISNEQSGLFENNEFQSIDNCGSLIVLNKYQQQPDQTLNIASNRNILNNIQDFSLINNNIIISSDRIIVNAKTNNVQIFSKNHIEISANSTIGIESDNIIIQSNKSIKFQVGSNQIIIDTSGIKIKTNKLTVEGSIELKNVQNGMTPGFCQMTTCAFTGAPHTVNKID